MYINNPLCLKFIKEIQYLNTFPRQENYFNEQNESSSHAIDFKYVIKYIM